ncbi:MAG TPA: IPT/TIG domain-containing protein [Candidatus Paceibacterota bacterium]|jgi:peptidoglycan hydrolase-like protein with peptidoglycan-binding domain
MSEQDHKNNKRTVVLVVIAVAIITVVWFVMAGPLGAQSVSELQATIQELQKRVGTLQAQLVQLTEGGGSTGTTSAALTLTRDLTVGDRGEDVRALQVFLNSDTQTRIATSGPGSPGNETDYFGPLTAQAVARYQELHRDSILVPAGLTTGSGYVGALTRAQLAIAKEATGSAKPAVAGTDSIYESTLSQNALPSNPAEVFEQLATNFQDYDELILSLPSRYDGPRGTTVSISGFGFTKTENTVHLGDTTIENIPSRSGTSISFAIPEDAPLGKHALYATNAKGTSNKNLLFVVTDPSVPGPRITLVAPESGFYGEKVTISGSGFTKEGNDVYTSYGAVMSVASPDGTTLMFQVLPHPENPLLEVGKDLGQGIEWPIWLYVVNDRGISGEFGKFTLHI